MRSALTLLILISCAAGLLACEDKAPPVAPTATARALPSPADLPAEPAGDYTLIDSDFIALPGARAEFGRLGGTVYRLEVPDDWNRRLVLFLHGSHDDTDELFVQDPPIREYLIQGGYAWAASSYSANSDRTFNHARDTAALWDFAVDRLGRPDRSYVTGESIGGLGTVLSAIHYADRYDGGLAVCPNASSTANYDYRASGLFVAGAYVAGVTQQEFQGADIERLISERIKPALITDPAARTRWEDIVIDLSGGERPFGREGLRLNFDQIWDYAHGIVQAGLLNNGDRVYTFSPAAGVAADDFNARAVRNHDFNTGLHELLGEADKWTGDLQIPLVTLHTTGDAANPLYWQSVLHDSVAAAGKSDLLVQRAVRAAGHCTQTDSEWEAAFDALVGWVEDGRKPEGEDLTDEFADAGKFTLVPRPEDPPGEDVTRWLIAVCGLNRTLAEGETALPETAQDPATLTLAERRERAENLWPPVVALNDAFVSALDQINVPTRVRALHDAVRNVHVTIAEGLRQAAEEYNLIFSSVESVDAYNERFNAQDDTAADAVYDLLRLDAPLIGRYTSTPECAGTDLARP